MSNPKTLIPRLREQKSSPQVQLSREQQLELVLQVQERIAVLKQKKDGFTPEEKQIIFRGDRAFESLAIQFRRMIFSLVNRYTITTSYTFDEMYEYGLIEMERAVTRFDPSRGFAISGVVFAYVRNKFFVLNKKILVEERRTTKRDIYLMASPLADERSPLAVALEAEEKMIASLLRECLCRKNDTESRPRELVAA
jgi:DNA-directed RNA polymerase specialized sigma subunit